MRPDFVRTIFKYAVEGRAVGEFVLAVVSSLVATGIIELVKLLFQNLKGGVLMFPGIARLLVA